jgi:hypothetical protein
MSYRNGFLETNRREEAKIGHRVRGRSSLKKANTMKKQIGCARNSYIITGLLSIMLSAAVNAAEADSCQASCAVDLTECRKQVDKTTMTESHPLLVDSSTRTRYATGQASALIDPKELANPQNEEVQRRRMERNQACATDNSKCLNRCSPAGNTPKNSVILK